MPRPKDYEINEEIPVDNRYLRIRPDDPDRPPGKAEQAKTTTPPGKSKTAPAEAVVHDPDTDETLRELEEQREEFIIPPEDPAA
jgi:hypothetical protein